MWKRKDVRNNLCPGLELPIEFLFERRHDRRKEIKKNTIGIAHVLLFGVSQSKRNILPAEPDPQFAEQPDGGNVLPPNGPEIGMQALGSDQNAPVPRPEIVDGLRTLEPGKAHHFLRHPLRRGHERNAYEKIAHQRHEDNQRKQDREAEEQICQNDAVSVRQRAGAPTIE